MIRYLLLGCTFLTVTQCLAMAKRIPRAGDEVFISDFENGNFSGWDTKRISKPYSAIIQSDVVRSGKKAVRFELRQEDRVSEGFRTELKDPYYAPAFKETWYKLSFFVPEDFPIEPTNSCVFAQWHDKQDPGDGDRNPPIAIRLRGSGRLHITARYSAEKIQNGVAGPEVLLYEDPAFKRNVWNDMTVRVFWSYKQDGLVQIWRNNEMIVNYRGPIGYNDDVGPYLKMGVYCKDTPAKPLVAYHDNYQRAPSAKQLK